MINSLKYKKIAYFCSMKNLPKEPVEVYPNYFVYKDGTLTRGLKQVKFHLNAYGYKTTKINIDGIYRTHFSHRLIAIAFIPNPENKPQINHINGIKTDNRIENLEWCTSKENVDHAITTGLFTPRAKTTVILICDNCGKDAYKKKWHINYRTKKSCSLAFCNALCHKEYKLKKSQNKDKMELLTKGRIKRQKRTESIKKQYEELKADPSNMRSAIIDQLIKTHKVSMATVYRAIK